MKLKLLLAAIVCAGIYTNAYAQNNIVLRGFNTPAWKPFMQIDKIAEEGANFLRWEIFPGWVNNPTTPEAWQISVQAELDDLQTYLPQLAQHGIYIIVDLHTTPGGSAKNMTPEWRAAFVETWSQIALRLKDEPMVLGYGLLNEPHFRKQSEWISLVNATIPVIKQFNPTKKIIVTEGVGGGQAETFSKLPIIPGVDIYEFHMYAPTTYTFQQLSSKYPAHKHYTKNMAVKYLEKVRAWQRSHGNPPILLGEFGCVRWAPDAYKYLREIVNYANKYNWHWAYITWQDDGSTVFELGYPAAPKVITGPRIITNRTLLIRQALTGAQVK